MCIQHRVVFLLIILLSVKLLELNSLVLHLTFVCQDAQRRIDDLQQHVKDTERDKESLRRQFDLQTQHLPGVSLNYSKQV